MKLFCKIAACIALAAPLAPALAQDDVSTTVTYGDLDLSRHENVARLDRRIATAARQVCGLPASRSIHDINAMMACRTAAVETAERNLRTRIASARSGGASAGCGNSVALYTFEQDRGPACRGGD